MPPAKKSSSRKRPTRKTASKRKASTRKKKPTKRRAWKPAFLAAYALTGNVRAAAEAAQINRSTAYRGRDADAKFAQAWDEATEDAADRLEQEARRRAVLGTEVPVYQGGKLVGTKREFSDTLLIFLLKGIRPEKYRERQHIEHEGRLILSHLSDDELSAAIGRLRNARGEQK